MNQNFKVIFNSSLGILQVVSEHARGKSKSKTVRGTVATVTMTAIALALGLALAPAARAQSVTFDGVDQGPTATSTNNALGFGFGNPFTVIVDGVGAQWNAGITLLVGDLGAGQLTIQNGGIVQAPGGAVGDNGGTGNLTIDGAGSRLTSMGQFSIGTAGTGIVSITNGGKLSAADLQLGSSGVGDATLTLNSNGVLETGFVLKDTTQAFFGINGGILRATADQSNFLQGFSTGDIAIGSGGATIDTQNFNVGITTVGVFTGSGGLTKQGTGTLSIAGPNTWNGDTTISAGTLALDSYSQSSSKTLTIGATSASNYGKLNVSGTATFSADANLAVDVVSANTLANSRTLSGIITAGTLNATTFNVTDNSALFDFQAVLNGNSVDLNVIQFNHTGVRDGVLAAGVSSASDAARVLDGLITAAPGGDMGTVITALGQLSTQRDVGRAAAQTLPLNSGVTQTTFAMLDSFNDVVKNRLSSADGKATGISSGDGAADRHVWAKAFGSRAVQDDRDGTSGFNANSWGMAFGVDNEVSKGTLLGLTYAYANSDVDGNTALSGAAQHADIGSHVLGIYGSTALPNAMKLNFQADIGRSHTDGSRNINFGGLNRQATSSYATYSGHIGAGLSKDIALSECTTFTPDVRADYTQLHARSYSESGAGALNLDVDADTVSAFVLSADGRVRHALTDHSWFSANLGAGYDTINDRTNLVSVYAGAPGQSFTSTGIDHSPWLINAGIGYTYQANSGMHVALRYDVDGRSGYLNQTASLKANWVF